MRLKQIIPTLFIFLFLLTGCMSEEEKVTQDFVSHAKKVDIVALKKMSTEDTQYYMKMFIEAPLSFGDASSVQLFKKIAATIECSSGEGNSICTYIDENKKKQSFKLLFVEGINESGEEQLFVNIDKEYFVGDF